MHSLSLILAAAAIGLGLSVVDRPTTEATAYHGHGVQHASFLNR